MKTVLILGEIALIKLFYRGFRSHRSAISYFLRAVKIVASRSITLIDLVFAFVTFV